MKSNLNPESGNKLAGTAGTLLDEKGRRVYSIGPDASVYDAVARMAEHNVGALFVLEGSRLVGVISERDYTRKVILFDRTSRETPVRDVMTTPVIHVDGSTPLSECMRIISHHRVRHLPVVDAGRVVGVVSIGDLMHKIVAQQAEAIEQLSAMITDHYPV